MLRVAWVIAVVSLGALTGCRLVPPATVVDGRDESAAENSMPAKDVGPPAAEFRPVAFVQSPPVFDETAGHTERPELLPSVTLAPCRDAPLSLADLEGIALRSNPTLAAAAARLEAARGQRLQAGLYPNPVIGYHATEIGNQGTAGQQGGFVSQRFITGGKIRFDQAIAGKSIDEAHFRFHAQELRVLSDVQSRFYQALVAQRRLALSRDLAGIGDDLVRATAKLLEGRLGTENDLLQAEIRAEDAHMLLDNARNENIEARRRLTAVIGIPTMQMVPLTGELDGDHLPLDWDQSYGMVLGNNPELEAALARVDRASLAIARARKEVIPNVDLSVSVRHHNVTRDDVANVQVGLPIPLFDRNQGNLRIAEADWIASNSEVRRIELDLQDRLAIAYRRHANARQQVERYRRRMLPKAEKSLELVLDGYEKGQVQYLTLLTAQQTYLQVKLAYLDSLQELWGASVAIHGQLLSGSLGGIWDAG